MTAAHPLPLPEDDLDVRPLDAACLATLDPEERALAEAALERVASGTVRPVPHAEIAALIERQRVEALAAEGVDAGDISPKGQAAIRAAEQRLRARLAPA